ncbi:DUF4189 domain-containing protein [Burkholderia cepacia]|uniref:DUF4189 domain-containing protein n=1 Tax=Burkholderia cepacia TaxID=292 RepID=UPI0015890566
MTKACALLAVLLSTSTVAHAEGGCPAGQYPANGQGWQACYPIPGYDSGGGQSAPSQPRRPIWLDKWGAIASALHPKGIVTGVTGLQTRAQAEQGAMQDCHAKGGTDCKIETAYANECMALVAGHPGYAVWNGPTLDEAINNTTTQCKNGGSTNCHAIYAACSLPARLN